MSLRYKRKNIILKLDNYRKKIRFIKLIDFYKNRIILVCHFIFLGSHSLKLLRDYFCSKVFELYNYKDNFDFVMISSQNQNYLYNYKVQKLLNKNIFFFLRNFEEVASFLYRIKMLTLSPYFFYPLFLSISNRKLVLSFSLFSKYIANYKYKYNKNSFLYYNYINIIKKVFFIMFIFIIRRVSELIKIS